MKSKSAIFLTIAMLVTACNYQFRETAPTDGNSNSTSAASNEKAENIKKDEANLAAENKADGEDATGPLVITGTSQTVVHPCSNREVEIDKDATANLVTLTGECKKLTVDGVSNKVSVEKVGEIIVKGVSNKVTYTEGLNGKKPKITKSGTSLEVNSKEELEKKAAASK